VIQEKYYTARGAAQALGISKQTLVRYEAKGFFPKAKRNTLNRWREYTAKDIERLRKMMGRG